MVSMILSNSLSISSFLRFNDPQQQQQLFVNPCSRNSPILQLNKSRKGISVVTRAGGISSGSYIFAVIFPLSLLAITIFTSARIADTLDQKFLEERGSCYLIGMGITLWIFPSIGIVAIEERKAC